MTGTQILLWTITTLGLAIFLKFYFIPFIQNKWTFYIASRAIKKMSKRYDGELGEQLADIAKKLKELSKNEKLMQDDE